MLKATARDRRSLRIGWAGVAFGAVGAALTGVLRAVNGDEAIRLEWSPLDACAITCVLAVPAVLAVIGLRGRPVLLVAAAVLSSLMALPIFYVALPMIVASPLYVVAFLRTTARRGPGWPEVVVAAAAGMLALAAAFTFYLVRSPSVCWSEVTYKDGTVRRSARVVADPSQFGETVSRPAAEDVASSRGGCSESPLLPARSVTMIALVAGSCAVAVAVPKATDEL